ncbi:MAG: energy transducer TonB, partial [Sphingomonadales bacterium]
MYARIDPRSRVLSAAGAIAVQALLILMLAHGLGMRTPTEEPRAMRVLDFAMDPPPAPKIEPERTSAPRPREEGAAAPPNIVSRATEIVVPPPVLPVPPIIPAATVPAQGPDASSGAAPVAGPGTGAGGAGTGSGSGNAGDGTGGGGGTVLRLLKGRIDNRDYPRSVVDAGEAQRGAA